MITKLRFNYLDSYSLGTDELTGKTLLYINGEFYYTTKKYITIRNYDDELYESDDHMNWIKCERANNQSA